jgi:hypothetical protein
MRSECYWLVLAETSQCNWFLAAAGPQTGIMRRFERQPLKPLPGFDAPCRYKPG